MRLLRWNHSLSLLLLAAAVAASGALLVTTISGASTDLPEGRPGHDPTVTLELQHRQRQQIRLAFPRFQDLGIRDQSGAEAARELDATLRQDLEWSGIFVIQGPEQLNVPLTGDAARDLEIYRGLGNEALLETTLEQRQGRLVLEGRVYDLRSGQPILGKRYQAELDLARRIAHTFADEIIRYFTGRPGIALSSIAFYSDRSGDKEIFLMDYDGFNQRPITAHKTISMSPSWSRRGQEISYVSFLTGPPGIFLVDLSGGGKAPIIDDGQHNLSPTFSPDGSRVAFARSIAGRWEIYVANRNGSNLQRLTHGTAIDTNPAWSPTGREIAFTSNRGGTPQIYVMDAHGTNVRRISTSGNYNDGASWAPDGDKLAYASQRSGVFQIVVADVVSRDESVVTAGGANSEKPTFSPDGSRLAFARTVSGEAGRATQIFTVNVDGTQLRRLTSEGNNQGPDWSGPGE